MTAARPRRSFIFCPGTRPEMFPKALASGADIACVDLEDAIAPAHKESARAKTLALFTDGPSDQSRVERVVRINALSSPEGEADVAAILASPAPPPALMLPKVAGPEEIEALDRRLTAAGLVTRLHVIIECNDGLEQAYRIARASGRLEALFFGGVDMSADLGCQPTWRALLYARSRVVHAAAGAGLDVIDVPYLDLEDADGMAQEAEAARELGFCGKGAIHPKQIPALNAVFTPDAATVARAKRILESFRHSEDGLVVIDGKLIEKPVLRAMERVLAIAERAGVAE
ncbi:MAG: CoA ester lyase [Pseudomonadota bacterium]